jgi:glycosyltransferase involved in cell wall biosynthesis
MPMSTALLVLTLDEVDGVREIMPKIDRNWVDELIIVDGGSTDGTIELAKEMGFKVISQKIKGHGGAIMAGVEATNSDIIIIFGPDGNHYPEEIPQLIKKINEGYDQVMISRFGKGSINLDATVIENFGNKMFAFLTNIFFGGHFTDTLNESRAITRQAFADLKFSAFRMNSTQQMSIRGLKKRQKIFEISGNEGERLGGKKKMNAVPVGADLSLGIIKEFIFWKY